MSTQPMIATWDGEALHPIKRFHNICNAELVVGQRYAVEIINGRSAKSHAAFFAEINDIWLSLPDDLAAQYPTDTILRQHALIVCGFATSRQYIASTKAEAIRVAALMRSDSEYSIVTVKGVIVTQLKAQSQNYRSMDGKTFQDSKSKTLDYCRALVGIDAKAHAA
jgi:hypothetical protein